MNVSVISLFYNRRELSRQYLEYWRRQLPRMPHVELIFGDSGSTDGTRALLQCYADIARIHLFEKNPGYAAGNNHLAAQAKGEILILLNNDTVPCDGWLDEILAAFAERPDVGIVGNLQLSVSTRQLDHAGVFFDADGQPSHFRPPLGSLHRLRWMPVPAITAACMGVRRTFFLELGGFDPAYVNGYEDTDLCLRAREKSRDILVATRSHIWHYITSSPGRHISEDANARRFAELRGPQARSLAGWTTPNLAQSAAPQQTPVDQFATLQIYFPSPTGYSEPASLRLLHPTHRWTRLEIPLRRDCLGFGQPVRLDPWHELKTMRLAGVALRDAFTGQLLWQARGETLRQCCTPAGTSEAIADRPCGLRSTGPDPQWLLTIPEPTQPTSDQLHLIVWLFAEPQAAVAEPPRSAPRKRVLVDLWQLRPGGAHGGIKVLVYELLKTLATDPAIALTCVIQPELRAELGPRLPRCPILELTADHYASANNGWLANFDVLYAPLGQSALRHADLPMIGLVVDLLHRDRPDCLPREEVLARECRLVEHLAMAESVQCNSRFVQETLRHHYGIEAHQCFVLYNAVQHRLPRDHAPRIKQAITPYFLYPANTWKHKNHARLLEAYRLYRARSRQPWDLVLTGSKVGGEIEGLPESTMLPDGVQWRGFLDDTAYGSLFSHAGALIFPSLYEGFGIPVLEALHLGVPVACSRIASLPEVGGDLASYFDPFSTEDIAEKMLQLEASGHAEHAAGNHLEKLFNWDENVARLKQALAHPPQRQ
ncbi:MAG TPA: glycosyltransferase [Opitutaceae bacterium]|nr:glycosyltransferase [Opitutaceae bacterium]HPG18001.1 glycosyltransferase [Opitutaceae bacterium]